MTVEEILSATDQYRYLYRWTGPNGKPRRHTYQVENLAREAPRTRLTPDAP